MKLIEGKTYRVSSRPHILKQYRGKKARVLFMFYSHYTVLIDNQVRTFRNHDSLILLYKTIYDL